MPLPLGWMSPAVKRLSPLGGASLPSFCSTTGTFGVMLGVASGTVMGPARHLTAAFTVLVGCMPATRMTSIALQNSTNCPGMRLVPSQGPLHGGSMVTVVGEGLGWRSMMCHVREQGGAVWDGIPRSSTAVLCMMPARPEEGPGGSNLASG